MPNACMAWVMLAANLGAAKARALPSLRASAMKALCAACSVASRAAKSAAASKRCNSVCHPA